MRVHIFLCHCGQKIPIHIIIIDLCGCNLHYLRVLGTNNPRLLWNVLNHFDPLLRNCAFVQAQWGYEYVCKTGARNHGMESNLLQRLHMVYAKL